MGLVIGYSLLTSPILYYSYKHLKRDYKMETTPTEPRRGWRTTEFWLNILAMIVSAIFMSGIPVEGIWGQIIGVIAFALTSMGYSISRGLAKSR